MEQLAAADRRIAQPHLGALRALLANPKLPAADHRRITRIALPAYERWRTQLGELLDAPAADPDTLLDALVAATDTYKRVLDLEVIYDSPEDFLPRQAGQLKLQSTVLEEFLPVLMCPQLLGELPDDVAAGPHRTLTSLTVDLHGRVTARSKDQDFALVRTVEVTTDGQTQTVQVPLVAVECKTNLDKTMFVGACATGAAMHDGVPGSAFLLACEWLDMAPQTTSGTGVDAVLILRGRRPAAGDRHHSRPAAQRRKERAEYAAFLEQFPLRAAPLRRLLDAARERVLADEVDPVARGWF